VDRTDDSLVHGERAYLPAGTLEPDYYAESRVSVWNL